MTSTLFRAGTHQVSITPPPRVELAGLGYYLARHGERIHDGLNATVLAIGDEQGGGAVLIALDLMMIDARFADAIRLEAAARTGLAAAAICVNCSHSHSAPTLGFFDGAGEIDEEYGSAVCAKVVAAVEIAWKARVPVKIYAGMARLPGVSYNRTREGGAVDDRISVLRAEKLDGGTLAIAVNFHAHPTVFWRTDLLAVSRDWPGQLCDLLEQRYTGATALYLQGTCGDSNLLLEYWTAERYRETGPLILDGALRAIAAERETGASGISARYELCPLPARTWTRAEVMEFHNEGLYRKKTGDTAGWLQGVARYVSGTPELLPDRYDGSVEKAVAAVARFAVGWSTHVLERFDWQPTSRLAEFQAIRIGDIYFSVNAAEFFSSLDLEIRARFPHDNLFVLGYSNGSISYLPDAYEVDRGSYASLQTPKATRQQPFTRDAGAGAVEASLRLLNQVVPGTGHEA